MHSPYIVCKRALYTCGTAIIDSDPRATGWPYVEAVGYIFDTGNIKYRKELEIKIISLQSDSRKAGKTNHLNLGQEEKKD